MILDDIKQWLNQTLLPWAIQNGLSELPAYTLEEPPAGIEAELACNIALLLAKPMRKNPRVIAQELQALLAKATGEKVESVSIAGAGFVNFRLALSYIQSLSQNLLVEGDRYGRLSPAPTERILIEFVSANPTGPLHVGHGRGAALGDSLALILAHLGYPVQREYYINDAGNQVQNLGLSLLERRKQFEGKPFELPAEGYHGDYLIPLAERYSREVPDGSADVRRATRFALDALQTNIENDLADFGVRFDSWFSEASLLEKGVVDKFIAQLKQKGYVQEYDDAIWFVTPGEKEDDDEKRNRDKDRVLKRRDGRWTYFASDIAYHADKYERGYQRLIDVWGADHHGYVQRVKSSMEALGHDPNQLHILLYQLVSLTRGGVPVSMSKRSGDFITLREVLKEVGKDACRLFFALRGPNTALDFDLELAKKHTSDNPVYYLQYAHARICSIFRQAPEKGAPALDPDASLGPLKEKEERELMIRLLMFPHALRVCAQENSPHPLANYLMALCRQFHHFYDHHRVLGEDLALTQARMALLQAVRQVLRLGLSLLGVSAPEAM